MERIKASGIIQNTSLAEIGVLSIPDRPGIAGAVFCALGDSDINVEFIVQCTDLSNRTHIILCVSQDDLEAALSTIAEVAEVQPEKVICRPDVAVISVFGPHFQDRPGVASIAFSALAAVGINILAISTSISTIACVIDGDHVARAVKSLREAFDVPSGAVFTASWGLSLHSGDGEAEAES